MMLKRRVEVRVRVPVCDQVRDSVRPAGLGQDKIVHGVDVSGLGFVSVVPGQVFVTTASFFAPFTTTPEGSLPRTGADAE